MPNRSEETAPARRRFSNRRAYRRWLKRQGPSGLADKRDTRHNLETLEQRTLLSASPVFELSDLLPGNGGNGSEGVVINGVSLGDRAGVSVSSAGDINGDGFDDVIIGAFRDAPNGADSGASFVVFGQAGGFSSTLQLSTLNGSNGFKINGINAGDFSGRSVAGAGDVNGDGFDDVLIGSFVASPNGAESGQVHVVYGKAGGFSATLELSALNGTDGFTIDGVSAGDRLGFSVKGAGDVNADGIDDFILGASLSANNGTDSGSAYIVFGQTGFGSSFDLATLNGSNGFLINGVSADDQLGISVSGAGDVNGDGIGDVVAGAFLDDPNGADSGAAFVVFGKTSPFAATVNLATLNGSNGFIINGGATLDNAGRSVSSAGDFNGDGIEDILIGASDADGSNADSGSAYVVFGQTGVFASSINLSTLNGTNGFKLNGIDTGDRAGLTVSSAGDVNGDGLDDLLVAADRANPNGTRSGETYLVLGRSTAMPASINMSALAGADGFVLNGINNQDSSGVDVRAAGDVDGDGFGDFIIGAFLADPNGGESGESYLVFGGDFSDAVTHQGSASQDALVGSGGADVMIAGRGNDVVAGNGGADVILAGEGDDEIEVADANFQRVDGGHGTDSLVLDGDGITLDLTTLQDSKLRNIEMIDLGEGTNTVTLNLQEVLNISGTSNTLTVSRNINGTINIGSGWTLANSQVINDEQQDTYTQGNATLILITRPDLIDPVLTVDTLVTSDRSPELTGTVVDADPATTVEITVNGIDYAATNNGDGTWTLPAGTISPDLADGVYEVTATGTDTAGNIGVDLPLMELTIDNGDPVVTIDTLATNVLSPELTGTITDLDPGTTISVNVDGKSYPATNNGDGTWTLAAGTINPDLTDGTYEVTVTAVDTNGHIGTDSTNNELIIDNIDPVVTINDPGTTDVVSPELTGTIDDLVTTTVIEVTINSIDYTATNNGDGTWTLPAGTLPNLPEGTYPVNVRATDAAGNVGQIPSTVDLTIDTAPVVTVNFLRTSDQRPELTGTVIDANTSATVTVTVDGVQYNATNNGNGTWILADDTVNVLADGTYDVVVSANDGNNIGTDSGTNDLVIDTSTPVVTINPLSTQDDTPGLSGTVSGLWDIVEVTVNGIKYTAGNGHNGQWFLADNVIASLPEGVYDVLVEATTLAEVPTTGTDNTTDELRIDQTAPTATVDTLSTSDRSPELTGTINETATSVISVTISGGGGTFIATNNGDGTWTVPNDDITPDLAPGTYDVTVTAVDEAGNSSGPVDFVGALTIEEAPFTITVDPLTTNDTTPQLTGEILGNFTGVLVIVTVNGTPYNATNNNDGTWTLADDTIAPALAEGVYDVSVSGTNSDPFNTTDDTTDELTIDLTAPVVTVDPLTTSDGTPELTGTVDDNTATITVTVNGNQYAATNNGDGTWTLADDTVSPALLNGTYDVQADATDAAGNASSDATTDELLIVTPPVASFDLEDLLISNGGDGTDGVVYQGVNGNDRSGVAASSAGDINGDGFDDLIIGANETDPGFNNEGSAYIIFGQASGFPAELDLSTLNGTNGFRIDGLLGGDDLGVSVDSAGDVNGDGLDDLVIGASKADPNGNRSGSAFVVYGSTGPYAATLNLATLNGSNGFRFDGENDSDQLGFSVNGAGDVNGDGLDDVIFGAPNADDGVTATTGRAYVVFGSTTALPATMTAANLNGTNGFIITGVESGASTAFSVSGAGDMNGDGLADLRISASGETVGPDASTGRTYVIFGSAAAFPTDFNLSTINGTNGFAVEGGIAGMGLGFSGAEAGDINGDGFDDLLVSTPSDNTPGTNGATYVIFGQGTPFAASISTTSLNGTNGFELVGANAGDDAGFNVSGVGDVNGDGFDDILIGARSADGLGPSRSGEAYLVFGKAGGYSASVDLGNIAGNGGVQFNGIDADDRTGRYVSGAGDVNGDGFDDLIIAARDANGFAGETYLVFGRDFTNSVTQVDGATGNTLNGTAGRDAIIAGAGDDISVGNGGPDILSSGQGDDTLAVSDNAFVRINGGNGFDTLRIDGAGTTLDLTTLGDSFIKGIEQIDLRGSGANTLTLDLQEVLNISDTSNTLLVMSDSDDTVNIGSGWTPAGTELIDGKTFDVFTQGNATLKLFTEGDTVDPVVTVDPLNTDDSTPELTGTVIDDDPLTTVQVTVNGIQYNATNNGDGTWTLADNTIAPALADGTYDVSVVAMDTAGNTGTDATTDELVIDTPLVGDLNGDGFVGIDDLTLVLGNWNQNVPPGDPQADPSGDGFVGIDDLNAVLGNWNAGTPPVAEAGSETASSEESTAPLQSAPATTADPLAEKVSLLDEVDTASPEPAADSSTSSTAWSWMQDAERSQHSAFLGDDEDESDSALDMAMPDPDAISRL